MQQKKRENFLYHFCVLQTFVCVLQTASGSIICRLLRHRQPFDLVDDRTKTSNQPNGFYANRLTTM